MINQLSKEIYKRNKEKGFYDSEKNIGEMLALIHSEVSEALECDRKDRYCLNSMLGENAISAVDRVNFKGVNDYTYEQAFEALIKDTFEDELADIMIRVMDLAGFMGIDLESHIHAKMRYNTLRPFKHGKKY